MLTKASGLFFERGERLFLVTSRHVLIDEPSAHRPDDILMTLTESDVDSAPPAGEAEEPSA